MYDGQKMPEPHCCSLQRWESIGLRLIKLTGWALSEHSMLNISMKNTTSCKHHTQQQSQKCQSNRHCLAVWHCGQ